MSAWDGKPTSPFPSVTLLMDFRGAVVGEFVFHCHILNHEDLGMMNSIRVLASTPANRKTVAPTMARQAGNGNGAPAAPAPGPCRDCAPHPAH